MRVAITLLVLAVFAVGTTWLLRQVGPTTNAPEAHSTHTPDYYFEHATLLQLNKQGRVESRLVAQLISHHPDDDSISLTQPRFTWYGDQPDDARVWHTVSARGRIPSGGKIIQLRGKVVATHPSGDGSALIVLSPTLELYPDKQQARTSATVDIIRGQNHVNAVGMVINFENDHLQLQSDVHGHYVY